MSLLLLYRPTLDETIFDADGDLGDHKRRKKKKVKAKSKKELVVSSAVKEEQRVQSVFVAVADEAGKKRLIEREIDDMLLLAMFLDE